VCLLNSELKTYVILISLLVIICNFSIYFHPAFGQVKFGERVINKGTSHPDIYDPQLKVDVAVEGLDTPTTIAFLGPNDFLVLEKDAGTVQRVINGNILDKPLLDVEVANSVERGMCGIAVSKIGSNVYVFLYFTEIDGKDGEDRKGKLPEGNRLYRYEFVNNQLLNPVLLLDLPADPGPRHNGGAIEIGPDNNIYIPVGDIDGSFEPFYTATKTQNSAAGIDADGRSGILRITQGGEPVGEGILGDSMPLRLYYAYGIRNSFGLAFDPITGLLWDTENGPQGGDEINLIYPGFNSGWHKVYGFSSSPKNFDVDEMVTFEDRGKYSEPKLVWGRTAGLTSLIFLNSDKLGTQYRNDMFVGDVHNGRIYHFKLNADRTELALPSSLASKTFTSLYAKGVDKILFGQGFGGITDLTVGPDGYLYIVSIGQGKVFRILPNLSGTSDTVDIQSENIPTANLSGASDTVDIQSENIPTANLSGASDIGGNNNVLSVSILPQKNPVATGDSQNITITVTDSVSRAVPNAEISGNLIYPGDNYETEFNGITDSQGKFVYSWIIGENGDVGTLSVEVDISSQDFRSSSATGSFDIIDSSAESG
jgi:glucose/arabinose dehydrogenase